MNIFSFFTLIGGLAFFLYGMNVMSSGLEKVAGGKLEQMLKKLTSNPFKSLALGAGITIAIQSSSALTVMLVGLVNSGIMNLSQTIGIIMGSNIGTTLTAWLLSLAGIESDNIFMNLLKPTSFSPIIAFIGILMIMTSKTSSKKKDLGSIFVGFAVLMYGMELMSDAMSPLADMPQFKNLLIAFKNPILGVLVGALFTGLIQSSAASIAILQALSATGSITYGMAIPIIMGQNIGTCVTALLSSIGVTKNAKKVAAIHVSFNVIGTTICLIVFYSLNAILDFAFVDTAIPLVGIACVHSIFNIVTTLMLLPFAKFLEKLANIMVKDKNESTEYEFLDERLLSSPSFALSECKNITNKMAEMAKDNILLTKKLIVKYDKKLVSTIKENENTIDMYEDKLGTCLVKLSSKELSDADSKEISKLLHSIGDFERIGDHSVNILNSLTEIYEKGITFSDEAKSQINVIYSALEEILTNTTKAFVTNDISLCKKIEPLEEVIDELVSHAKTYHIDRLQKGLCTIELGFVLSDILANFERVSDHCSNIAVCLIQVEDSNFDTHTYLHNIRKIDNSAFLIDFEKYREKFAF